MSTFPQPFKSTVSHWQATNRGVTSLFNHGRDDALPKDTVDYVIIGGGISGCSLAYHLTRPGVADGNSVVLLEAKDVASGASGRNGGHIAPLSFAAFPGLTAPLPQGGAGLTKDEALEVIEMEKGNLEYVTELVEKEKWDVDLWRGEKLEVKSSDNSAKTMKAAHDAWISARSHSRFAHIPPHWQWIDDPEEAKRLSRAKGAIACSKGSAGSVHSHKLTTAFMRDALGSGNCSLHSWAPVVSFAESEDGEDGWTVDCGERGKITARQVIVCTNAHTRHLFKGEAIDKHLTPFQGQAALVTPPPSFSGSNYLAHTYTLEKGPYLMFTPSAGIVLGLPYVVAFAEGIGEKPDVWEVTDDSYVKPELKKWLYEYCGKTFDDWGDEAPGEGGTRVWSGIQCASRDTLPLVGAVPGRKGLWVNVGHHGHGMGRIPFITRSLAATITTGQWDARLPRCFEITEKRLDKGQTSPPFITDEERRGETVPTAGWTGDGARTVTKGGWWSGVMSFVR